jgi:malate permease and related proteins
MADVNFKFFTFFAVILIGYLLKRAKFLTEEDGAGMARLVINLTLPALILDTIPSIHIDPTLTYMPFIALGYIVITFAVPFFAFKKSGRTLRGNLLMGVLGWNIGLFAYPLVESIWGKEGLKYIAMFDVGNAVVIFIICPIVAVYFSPNEGQADARTMVKKLLSLIPLWCYAIGMAMNLLHLQFMPFPAAVISFIGKANAPLVFLTLGVHLNLNLEPEYWGNLGRVFAIRYGLGLAAGLLLVVLVPSSTSLLGPVALVALIAPVGMAILPYTVQYGYDRRLTGALVNMSMLVSFGLTWMLVVLLRLS